MKRVLAIILAVTMLLACALSFSACTTLKKLDDGTYDKGAFIDLYIGDELYDFDPQLSYTDYNMVQLFSLLYEGLTTIGDDGKWEKALMKDYKLTNDKMTGERILVITLNDTRWSDGRTVQASDFMYSWKYRLLDPEFKTEAAALLFDIKNAKKAKAGDCSIDDVGISCPGTYELEIRFEDDANIDVDRFFENAASTALVPLREDIVTKGVWWARKVTSLVTNGPFTVKAMIFDKFLRIDRNQYYYLSQDDDSHEKLDKYVVPYRILTYYAIGNAHEQLAAFEAGLLNYLGEIPVSAREQYKKKAVVTDEMNILSCYLNTENDILKDSRVRRALSLAIDRAALANGLVFAEPAEGSITEGVFNTTRKTSFRKTGGTLFASSADVGEAKKLLDAAKSDGALWHGTLTITVRGADTTDATTNDNIYVAEALANTWNELLSKYDIKVEVKKINTAIVEIGGSKQSYYDDLFENAYKNGDFDILVGDLPMISTDAFATLAPFAVNYSGNGIDMQSKNYDAYGHVTGYNSEAYNALIDQAYAEKDAGKRAAILHDAENLLAQDMPVIPVVTTKDAYLVNSSVLKNVDTTYFGARDLKDTTTKNYMKLKENYDNQLLSVYSTLLDYILAVNDEDEFTWSEALSFKDFSLSMTMGEAATVISDNFYARTSEKDVLPRFISIIKEQFGVSLTGVSETTTFSELVKVICDALNSKK
ncbi:MAG: ABC transporter substrate-binding protein [Clostridia bacterium]|nr:ABC transporter substrate-binding protein [Clostridia bacterium]